MVFSNLFRAASMRVKEYIVAGHVRNEEAGDYRARQLKAKKNAGLPVHLLRCRGNSMPMQLY